MDELRDVARDLSSTVDDVGKRKIRRIVEIAEELERRAKIEETKFVNDATNNREIDLVCHPFHVKQ